MANQNIITDSQSAQICASRSHVLDIADIYVNRYTCGCMADRLADYERETAEANTWVLAQCSANGISLSDLRSAIDEVAETRYADTACMWDPRIFNKQEA